MDIYINYGDSRRIIELASGMEKMMAALAIRVALINISSLPKTSMLMIDEGFGSLDETNFSLRNKDSVSNIGTFLFNKLEGSSLGLLSTIKT